MRKYKEVSESLAKLDKKDLSPYEKSECEEALRREIYSIWGSDEIRREKPTPQTEAKGESITKLNHFYLSREQRPLKLLCLIPSDPIMRISLLHPHCASTGGLAIVETVLWDAVPSYLRKLNAQTIESLGKPIPLTLVPIQFSSWMGGEIESN